MASAYYLTAFVLSLLLAIVYLFMWHKHFDIHITLIFVLVPISNLGYVLLDRATNLEAALTATHVSYIGGCFLQLVLMLAVFGLCDIQLNRWVRALLLATSSLVYLGSLTMGRSESFYQGVALDLTGPTPTLVKDYGPLHAVFIGMVIAYFCASMAAMAYSYLRKSQVSRNTIRLLFLTELIAMVSFFVGRHFLPGIELMPAACDLALALYLVIARRLSLYDVSDATVDSLVQTGDTGFAAFDFRYRYLGSNETAKHVFPELAWMVVDRSIADDEFMAKTIIPWLEAFARDDEHDDVIYEKDGRFFRVHIQYLYGGRRKLGYHLFVTDDTESQRYIALLDSYNANLQREVEAKTAHIVQMHDNLVMGMATMVESRDNSTGGHIRRTSEGVRLLIAQMRAGSYDLSDEFCHDVIKAAPMHDLGKIAVDDAILRKPGRFTPEEFDQMKQHAAEGARIVHEILRETDDLTFHHIAENVAHYHHERWDGSGYPEGLAGEEIPLEARIMAIADVYDALVSKRVYKEAMAFDRADAIIMEGMGTQFDPALEAAYVAARPLLEEYYRSL